MRLLTKSTLLAGSVLPACLLAEPQWPYNLPSHVKYYPEDEPIVKRNVEIEKRVLASQPFAVKKMSDDPGDMFFLDFWAVEEKEILESGTGANSSMSPAIRLHIPQNELMPRWHQKRAFTCPAGTNSCSGIDRPNSCCTKGLTCVVVDDSGLGDVGCCADENNCEGESSSCPEDYTSCPNDGGGCCIPGYACQGIGCVQTSTTVVVVTPIPPSTASPSSTSTTSSAAASSEPAATTSTVSTTSLEPTSSVVATCTSGYRSCAASLGGGCCPTDRECGSRICPASTTTSAAPSTTPSEAAPVRPTSDAATTTAAATSSATATACPQNFYACSAYYPGAGCCQVGRDCSSTSCPGRETTSVLVSNGVTVVAAPTTGVCASDWSSCPATVGGGCCPSGYDCGTESCSAGTAAPSGSSTAVAKQNDASRTLGSSVLGLALGACIFWNAII